MKAVLLQNVQSLSEGGKLIVIGMMGGAIASNLELARLLMRSLAVLGSRLRPVIDSAYDWREVARAHARMEENANIGKIVLRVTE